LTIRAQFNASRNRQIFTGAGTVVGIREVYPEWFGAVGDGTTDDQPAFQKCITCLQGITNGASGSSGGKATVFIGAKNYAFGATWFIYQSANVPIWVEGAGTLLGGSRLVSTSGFTGTMVSIEGSSDSIQKIVDFGFKGIAIIATGAAIGSGTGLAFNSNVNNTLIGLQESIVEDVYIESFKFGILIQKTRLVNFNRVSVWNKNITGTSIANANWCVQIKDTLNGETGSFSGDMTWTNCLFDTNAATTYATGVSIETVTSGNNIAGIRFLQCIFYNAHNQFTIKTVVGTTVEDIWINSCQFDTCPDKAIEVTTAGTSRVTDLHITNNYFTAVAFNCIKLNAANTNGINAVVITDNYCAGVGTAAVDLTRCATVNIANNNWTGCSWTIGGPINVSDSNYINIIGNNCGQAGASLAGGFANFAILTGTGDYYIVQGNNSAGLATSSLVNNTTGATHTSITGNI
jgi:hypothetical protein